MFENKKVLALIPARGGSKGLPGKNIKQLLGKPLIAWSIEAAKKCDIIDRIVVSTDDKNIADISLDFGAEVPFLRPKELATDTAKALDVIKHSINFFKNKFDLVLILQPTSPLRTSKNILEAFNEYHRSDAKAIVSVCELEHPIQWFGKLPQDKSMADFTIEEYKNKNRQELEKYYRYNGAIYISEIDYLLENNGVVGKDTYAYIMERENSVDIDNILDFKIAEMLLKERNEKL